MLRPFEILQPQSLEEATGWLAEWGPDVAVYAGGTELLILMKEGLVHYPKLVDVKRIPGLSGIEVEHGKLRIGALATHRQLERSPIVLEHAPLLVEVERLVANVRVRNVGTLGGNLCFGEPHSDPATLLTAWGGELTLESADGSRKVSAPEFFLGLFETARREDEILTEIEIPILADDTGGGYRKAGFHERPTATVAAILSLENGAIREARLAAGSVGPRPVRVAAAENLMRGEGPTEDLFAEAGELVAQAVEPVDDIYGSAKYKRHLITVLAREALRQAAARAREGSGPDG